MKNWILLFLAGLIAYICLPIFFVYSILRNRFNRKMQDYILFQFAISIDIIGNLNGDLIRDLIIIDKSKTCIFNRQGITISASIGHLIVTGNINSLGIWFSERLNKAFNQKSHCVDAFNLLDLSSEQLESKPNNT